MRIYVIKSKYSNYLVEIDNILQIYKTKKEAKQQIKNYDDPSSWQLAKITFKKEPYFGGNMVYYAMSSLSKKS